MGYAEERAEGEKSSLLAATEDATGAMLHIVFEQGTTSECFSRWVLKQVRGGYQRQHCQTEGVLVTSFETADQRLRTSYGASALFVLSRGAKQDWGA